ncbi:hypothetical protein [Nitrosomonas sp.]|jgi:hypothetical protein|uniref:hypothetical protein n=1 Tax=Nitrosomonas sp. TaxID=42353 RepID=UPI0025FC4FAC|nr:hypothetical protein [Nitrosomonas sp.]
MSFENFINLDNSELDVPIYRIMPIDRLLQCFEEKSIVLVPPKKWDDPFENLLLSSQVVVSESGEIGGIEPIRNQVFGQCWTLHRETDAMWRIYSPDKGGAKVKTTPRKLLGALNSCDSNFADIHCFIGRVAYLTQTDLVTTLSGLDLFNPNGSGIARSLLYKRKEFSHEKEVRLIYTNGKGSLHKFSIDPCDLFDEIVFDPRSNEHLLKAYKTSIQNYGYKNRIEKSVLYQLPKGLVLKLIQR